MPESPILNEPTGPPVGRRVLVIGATGQLGRELVRALQIWPQPVEVFTASRSDPDPDRRAWLEHPETLERVIAAVRPAHVILAAAATNVAWCEDNAGASHTINVVGTDAAARAAHRIGANLVFLSTDYVFDGEAGPYAESAATRPINVYGAHKLAAEEAVLEQNPGNLVVRTCQVFGDDPRRTNFVMRVVDRLRQGETVEAAGDLYGTPTYAPDLARILAEFALTSANGVWHVAGTTFLSRYELAHMAAAAFSCDRGSIVEVSTDHMDDPVNRPRRAGLLTHRLQVTGGRATTPLADALRDLAAKEARP